MCKLLMMAGVKAEKQKAAKKFLLSALPSMTANDKDGVGFVASRLDNGNLFGERWVKPNEAFTVRRELTGADEGIKSMLGSAVTVIPTYNSFGDSGDFSSFLLHSRMATCGVNIANTHPFVAEDTALIHNGVISNHSSLTKKTSTCDSEVILHEYLDTGSDTHPEDIQDMADKLEGYYACGILSKDFNNVRILDIFKSEQASLYVGYVKSIEAWVYATTEHILKDAAKKAKTFVHTVYPINAGNLIRLNATTGEVMKVVTFKPKLRFSVGGNIGSYLKAQEKGYWGNDNDDDRDIWKDSNFSDSKATEDEIELQLYKRP